MLVSGRESWRHGRLRRDFISYSEHFADGDQAARYDAREYGENTYSSLLWQIEKRQLDTVLDELDREGFRYLDFACGTGRVLAHVSPRASSSTGIDVSEAMAARARKRVPTAQVKVQDITSGGPVDGPYDVITAFRFVLNAEPELRVAALKALAARMDGQSVLILNNHGNLLSHKAVMAIPDRLRAHGRRRQSGNRMSHREVLAAARSAGLEVNRVAGCGVLGGRLARLLAPSLAMRVELRAADSPMSALGSNQLYRARLRSPAESPR